MYTRIGLRQRHIFKRASTGLVGVSSSHHPDRICLALVPRPSGTNARCGGEHVSNQRWVSTLKKYSSVHEPRGLFSIPQLQKPSDFMSMAASAMEECDRLRRNLPDVEGVKVLYQLDAISQAVCNVIDAAELARSTHSQESWREAAHRAFSVLSEYITHLNSDPALYRALVQVIEKDYQKLTEEELRFASLLKAEFEKEGIHLQDEETLSQLRNLHSVTTELESLFTRNLVSEPKSFRASTKAVTDVLPSHVLHSFQNRVGVADPDPSYVVLPGEATLLQSLLKYSSDPTLRRQVYLESVTGVPENLPVLQSLVSSRQQLAQLLGFESYADYFLCDKMAGNQTRVLEFLDKLQQQIKPAFRKDIQLLADAKRRVEGTETIEPWDVPFYVGLLKARDGFDINSVSHFLQLENCVDGMQTLVQKLFGIEMKEEPMADDERWDGGSGADDAHRVRRFDFYDSGDSIGTMYLDLHPRPGKYGHAAHFTVRCGCRLNSGSMEPDVYQLPIVALVCNLSSGREGALAHSEVETLYHEFGHALHSLMSKTKFQHMSGTRAAMDFVETPSHLIENFVWDPQFLRIVARHHATGEPIPDQMIQELIKSRYEFYAIERQNQIIYAVFDQKLFGKSNGSNPSSVELFEQLHLENGVPYAKGTHWHSRFGHLVTYGAGYYGYLFSQAFAADIWNVCFQGRSLSRDAGERLWHGLLAHGGAKDPWVMLTDILGRPPMSIG